MTAAPRLIRRTAPGFTLLELMIVIVIIGVLGAIVGLNLVGAAERAKRDASIASMRTIQQALKMYHARYSAYPPTVMGFQTLVNENILASIPKDGWDRPFEYYSPGPNSFYLIVSYGADGVPDGEPDIYWTERDE